MIARDIVLRNLGKYRKDKIKIGVLGSHSALDTCDGAVEEGFRTLAVCQDGRTEHTRDTSKHKGTQTAR